MNKKLITILSILFLSSLLMLSCNNNDKTGSGNTGQTGEKGLKTYAGDWKLISDQGSSTDSKITIKGDGTVVFMGADFKQIQYNGNEEYVVQYKYDTGSSN